MKRFFLALLGAIVVGAFALYVLGLLFTGTLKVVGWLLGALIAIGAFYLIFKILQDKVEGAVEDHRERKERREQRAAVQEDLRGMENDRPSGDRSGDDRRDGRSSQD
ncbi:MAG: hypothetical protein ACK5NN_15640 [Sphingomonadaceae bacterium]